MSGPGWLIIAFLSIACAARTPTALVIEVRSELKVPEELDRLLITARARGGWVLQQSRDLGTGPGRISLPVRFALVPEAPAPAVTVELEGQRAGKTVIEVRQNVTFTPGATIDLPIELSRDCLHVRCPALLTCEPQRQGCGDLPTVSGPPDAGAGPEPPGPRWIDRTPTIVTSDWRWPKVEPMVLAFDEVRGHVWLFGRDGSGASELWAWSGLSATWTNRTPDPRPGDWPGGPYGWYDRTRDALMIFNPPPSPSTLHLWDDAAGGWKTLEDVTPMRDQPSQKRIGYEVVFDPTSSAVILIAADSPPDAPDFNQFTLNVWEWPLGSQVWRRRSSHPFTSPSFLRAAAWDPVRGVIVVCAENRIMEWDPRTNAWLDRSANRAPVSRPSLGSRTSNLVWHPRRRVHAWVLDGALWEWDGRAGEWAHRGGTGSLSVDSVLTYDSVRDRLVAYGGERIFEWLDGP